MEKTAGAYQMRHSRILSPTLRHQLTCQTWLQICLFLLTSEEVLLATVSQNLEERSEGESVVVNLVHVAMAAIVGEKNRCLARGRGERQWRSTGKGFVSRMPHQSFSMSPTAGSGACLRTLLPEVFPRQPLFLLNSFPMR